MTNRLPRPGEDEPAPTPGELAVLLWRAVRPVVRRLLWALAAGFFILGFAALILHCGH